MEALKRDPRGQGDKGELSAILWLGAQGAAVFLPLGHCRDYDLIADFGGGLLRVQVKTSSCFVNERWDVTLCTRGGNRSWNGLVKYLDPSRYDVLFVLVGEGRRWFIPAREVAGTTRIVLGGPKYSEHEVDAGEALHKGPPTLDSTAPRRDSRAVKGDAL